jgi:parallel beta-helix repeat protein
LIEIRTQAEFDTIFATGMSMPSDELIRIFDLGDGAEYITEGIEITKSNVFIEGINHPKIKQTTASTEKDVLYIHGASSAEADVLENITIRGLHLIGDRNHAGGATGRYGIYVENCGFAQTTGLTSGDYSRYDSNTVGNTKTNKIGVRIENCTVEDCHQYGVYLNISKNCKLLGNTVQNNSNGIRLNTSANNNTVTGNTVQNNGGSGIYLNSSSHNIITGNTVQNNSSQGIFLNSSSNNNTITGNTVQNNSRHGIYLDSANNSTITGNTVQNNRGQGIYLYSSPNNTITGNTVQNNSSYCICLDSSSNNSITGNTVQNNSNNGILLSSSDSNTITGNTVQNNGGIGIFLGSSNMNCIANNNIYQNGSYGIQLSSTGNTYNNIYGNISQQNTSGNYNSGGGTGNQIWANMNIY